MEKAPAFPNVRIFIDAGKMYMATTGMDAFEFGNLIFQIIKISQNGDFPSVLSLPFVSRIEKGTAKRIHIPVSTKRNILSRGNCAFCGSKENLTIDHIVPYSKTRDNSIFNLQCLCWDCNRKKGCGKNEKPRIPILCQ